MANQNLGNATLVSTMLKGNSVLVEIDGSIRRITLDNLMNAINKDDEQLLRQVAWGVPIKQNQTSPEWGVVGNIGMWNEYKSMCGRYLLTNDGKAAKLSPVNGTLFADGTTLDQTKGHIMFIAPRLYYKIVREASSEIDYLWMSMLPIGGNYIGGANNGEYICVGAYIGSMNGSAFTSRSGVKPQGSKTINQFWDAAQVNGKDFGLMDYDFYRYQMMLCLSEYGSPNAQEKIGYGIGGSSALSLWATAQNLLTGATDSLGDKCGNIPISVVNGSITGVNCSRVNLFGIEDPYNWLDFMVQGIYFGKSENSAQTGTEVFIYEGNRMPDSNELATHPNGKYRQITRQAGTASSSYISKMVIGDYFDLIPTANGGGSNSYWCDGEWRNSTAGQLLVVCGEANLGSLSGLVLVSSPGAFSVWSANFGSRLAYYGPIVFTSGKQLMAS